MIDANKILAIAPAAAPYVTHLLAQMHTARIDATPERGAGFLAQVHVESGGFEQVVESLNYSTTALLKLFGRHRITSEQAHQFGRNSAHRANQTMLANILYGGEFGRKQLGNTEPGDGWRFRGRGLKQLTGRANYRAFSKAWLKDETLLLRPELVELPPGAVASAIWFWTKNRLNEVADGGSSSVAAVTRVVNGGAIGLSERKRWYAEYLKAFRS